MASASLQPVSLATGRGKITVAVPCVVGFFAFVAVSLPNVALPTIQRDLFRAGQSLQWIPAYLLTLGGFMLLGGHATDLFGRRRLLVIGITIFATPCLVAGLAANLAVLIGGRLIQMPLVCVPIIAGTFWLVGGEPRHGEHARLDLTWAILASTGALLLVHGLVQSPQQGWRSVPSPRSPERCFRSSSPPESTQQAA
jgi:MFS family permease